MTLDNTPAGQASGYFTAWDEVTGADPALRPDYIARVTNSAGEVFELTHDNLRAVIDDLAEAKRELAEARATLAQVRLFLQPLWDNAMAWFATTWRALKPFIAEADEPQPAAVPQDDTEAAQFSCGRTHVCWTCSPHPDVPGPGCRNCRNTGYDQTPCMGCAAAATS